MGHTLILAFADRIEDRRGGIHCFQGCVHALVVVEEVFAFLESEQFTAAIVHRRLVQSPEGKNMLVPVHKRDCSAVHFDRGGHCVVEDERVRVVGNDDLAGIAIGNRDVVFRIAVVDAEEMDTGMYLIGTGSGLHEVLLSSVW